MDGILNIDKPRGRTSFSIVAQVRRLSGERRVGHAGTLDPEATGVLPVCLGRATRVIEYLIDRSKGYRAEIELGLETDTYDAAGSVTRRSEVSGIDRRQVSAALEAFRGPIWQTPPMFSAVKHQGLPLYRLARAGVTVDRQPRAVEISRLHLLGWEPPVASIDIECSKGTYIRSLAADIGAALGCGAILRSLVRTRCGPFRIEEAVTADEAAMALRQGRIAEHLVSISSVLSHLAAAVVGDEAVSDVVNGRLVDLEGEEAGSAPGGSLRVAYSAEGRLLGILRFDEESGKWRPRKVLA